MSIPSILDPFDAVLEECVPAFTNPSTFALWARLLYGFVLTVSRHTITGMILLADPLGLRPHDAYHRLMRVGAWSLTMIFRVLARHVVALLPPTAVIPLVADDTLLHHGGSRVEGTGWYRDPVRSTGSKKTVHAHGLSVVLLAIRIIPPWGGPPVALPIAMRVHPKGGEDTYLALLAEMLTDVRAWFPGRQFNLVVDGAYASISKQADGTLTVMSRMRSDAKIFELPPPPNPHKRGPKPKKGARLPTPAQMAADPALEWTEHVVRRGTKVFFRQVATRLVIWHAVCPNTVVRILLVRDPQGKEDDDFFFTTAVKQSASQAITEYGDRWPIEVTIRDSKQLLGVEELQCWKGEGPERAAGLGLWLHSLVWLMYLTAYATTPCETPPWYAHKRAPSFADALAAVRTALWARQLAMVTAMRGAEGISKLLIAFLARAA